MDLRNVFLTEMYWRPGVFDPNWFYAELLLVLLVVELGLLDLPPDGFVASPLQVFQTALVLPLCRGHVAQRQLRLAQTVRHIWVRQQHVSGLHGVLVELG